MVLFNDTLPPKPPTLIGKCLTWALRLVLLIIVLFGFFVGSLNLLQGTGDTQKSGLEKTINALTNRSTNITKLIKFELFPELHVAFKGVKNGLFSDRYASVYSFKLRAPGSSLFNQSGVIREIDIQHLKFIEDGNLIHHIEQVYIDAEDKQNQKLIIEFIKPKDLSVTIGLTGTTNLKIAKDAPFSVTWNDNSLHGYLTDDGFITGTGSLKEPTLGLQAGQLDCFFGKLSLSSQYLGISDLWAKTSKEDLTKIPSVSFTTFSQPTFAEASDMIYDEDIKNSTCANFLNTQE